MSPTEQHHGRDEGYRHRRLEMLIFLAISAVGVFAFGQGMRGFFLPGARIDLGWLAIAGGAFWVLYAQMCRVQAEVAAAARRQTPSAPVAEKEDAEMKLHRDTYSVIAGMLILAGLVALLLTVVNPLH